MRSTIQRKMLISTVNAVSINFVDGETITKQLEPLQVMGKIKEKTALKELTKIYGKDNFIKITSIDEQEKMYTISVEDFLKLAKPVEETETKSN